MKLIVNPHKIEIEKTPVNEKEINITECEFEFSEEITQDFVKDVYFTLGNTTIKMANIQNNKCDIPNEVLTKKGTIEIGVVAYLVENEEEIKRYNPSPAYFNSWVGSLKSNAQNTEPVTPSDKEQMEQALNDMETKIDNLDIDAEKVGTTATIIVTKKDGTQETILIEDGEDGADFQYNWSGTSLGVKTSEEQDYQYVNLKGDTGEPGQIEFVIVSELPQTGVEGTIYLVPLEEPDMQENNYAEYIWVNDDWELLGKIGVHIDLSNYYTKTETNSLLNDKVGFTDYASTNTAGAIKVKSSNGTNITDSGYLISFTRDYAAYQADPNSILIGKGTLEQVIAGKGLVSNTDYASTTKGGVIKTSSTYRTGKISSGELTAITTTYSDYQSANNSSFVSKGTLENVITGKNLETANNKVTSISSNSTDTEYPSAKCVYDSQEEQNTIIENQANEIEYLNSVIEQAFDEITDEDTEITLNNTIQAKMKMELKGNTEQTTYTGKNLFDKNDNNIILNFRIGQDGGNYYAENYYISPFIKVNPNTQYTKNSPTADSYHRFAFYTSNNVSSIIGVSENNTYTTPSNCEYIRFCGLQTELDTTMLVQGSTTGDYEPYVGGTPSPNPDYPQDVRVVTGNNSVNVIGKNLLDKDNVRDGYRITQNGYYAEAGYSATEIINVKPNTTYSTSWTMFWGACVCTYDKNDNFSRRIQNGTSFTTTSTEYYIRACVENNILSTAQIEIGSSSSSYQPYQSQTYPINLGTMELCKIGSYQDYIYKDSGKWYKHSEIQKTVITEDNKNIIDSLSTQNEHERILINKDSLGWKFSWDSNVALINKYKEITSSSAVNSGTFGTNFTQGALTIWNDDFTDLATARNLLIGTEIYIVKTTPTNEEITDTTLIGQLNNLEKAMSYKAQTNISQTNANLPFILYANALGKNQ